MNAYSAPSTTLTPSQRPHQGPDTPTPVAVAHGDGIGPEIMAASLEMLGAAGARLDIHAVDVGEQAYLSGCSSGIPAPAWETLRKTKVLYKGPITTPQGGGVKSLNVTLRKTLGLYANLRPCTAYAPFIPTKHPGMDVIIVRENEEDLYAGIEHRQTDDVYQCLKLITRSGCERIVRFAFETARLHGRKKVTCITKDNIMKMTDGLFHKVFDEIGRSYPEIEQEHLIVDIAAARLANRPGDFDVIVTSNLYGDILSDVAAEIAGSVGLAPSANIGATCAMFEAIHGSAPPLAGRDVANPTGLMLAGVMMLSHLGQTEVAQRAHNAILCAIEDGIHTADIHLHGQSAALAGTRAFTRAVIDRMGETPKILRAPRYSAAPRPMTVDTAPTPPARKALVGIDVFVHARTSPAEMAARFEAALNELGHLVMISNRGVKVWPDGAPETLLSDHWRCRVMAKPHCQFNKQMAVELLRNLAYAGVDFIKTEHLYTFDGAPAFTLGQGQ